MREGKRKERERERERREGEEEGCRGKRGIMEGGRGEGERKIRKKRDRKGGK